MFLFFLVHTEISEQILIACENNIRRLSLDIEDWIDIYLPINNLIDVVSFDFHYRHGQIFYADSQTNEIRSLKIVSGKNLSQLAEASLLKTITIITSDNNRKITSIAVDWIADNIYWSDQERHIIEVARIDGSSRKILIDLDLDEPKCLEVMPNSGFLFWINGGNNQKIERGLIDTLLLFPLSLLFLFIHFFHLIKKLF